MCTPGFFFLIFYFFFQSKYAGKHRQKAYCRRDANFICSPRAHSMVFGCGFCATLQDILISRPCEADEIYRWELNPRHGHDGARVGGAGSRRLPLKNLPGHLKSAPTPAPLHFKKEVRSGGRGAGRGALPHFKPKNGACIAVALNIQMSRPRDHRPPVRGAAPQPSALSAGYIFSGELCH